MTHMELTRRSFVVTAAAAAGGGIMLGVASANAAAINGSPWMSPTTKDGTEINHWVVIDPDGAVTVRISYTEMGNGAMTAIPMILNEELSADWGMIRAEFANVNRHVTNDNLWGRMATGGSGTVRSGRVLFQQAGASVRERLKAAAAAAWGVDVSTVVAKDSMLMSGSNHGMYADFATAAASIALAEEPAIKTPDQFEFLGTSVVRLDNPLKVNGSAKYGIDTRIPGMVYAAVATPAVRDGKVKSYDAAAIADRPGILQVVELVQHPDATERRDVRNGVVVIADTWYRAKTALELMPIEWDLGPNSNVTQEGLEVMFTAALDTPGEVRREEGSDTLGIISRSNNVMTADFIRPFEPHVCMEPFNCTVSIGDNRVDLHVSTQNPPGAVQSITDQLGIDPGMVHLHTPFIGGGFGRRFSHDEVRQAAEIARLSGLPVKMVWTREEDIMQGSHRPMGAARIMAALGDDGLPTAIWSRNTAHYRALAEMPYNIPNQHHELTKTASHIPTTAHRAPGTNVNSFTSEQFVDEMALAAGWDPLEWRIHMTTNNDKADWNLMFRTLKSVSGFTTDLPRGEGIGVAGAYDHGSIVANAVHISVSRRGQLRINKVDVVLDAGHIINPLGAVTQMEGGTGFEISHTLLGGLTVSDGSFHKNNNYDTFHMARIADMPEVAVHFSLSGGEKWGGCGEPPVAAFGAALANAIFFATGKRLRSTPISKHDLSWS
jgi:isoquinoline 1-oxidoreductase beta subunit